MNKKLLTLAAVAAMSVSSISAAEVSLLNDNSFTANDLNVQFSAITPVDGVLTLSITADPAQPYSNQLFITANGACRRRYIYICHGGKIDFSPKDRVSGSW